MSVERVVDLARAEIQGEPPVVILGGERFTLPHEMPYTVMEAFVARDREGFMRPLLGDSYERFWALGISAADSDEFVEQILVIYGVGGPGNSSASGDSSKSNGTRSKPTSPATTKSTSAKRAGASKP